MNIILFLVFFCTFVSNFSVYFTAATTITTNSSIREGQTLISSGEIFELGFFGSEKRYLGIWYKNITTHTVVWVANRENPLNDLSGTLKLDNHGNLVIVNRIGSVVWSTNISGDAINPVAELLDTGNLVLRDNNNGNSNSYLWQSFDFPSDTLLPGMKLGWTSWDGLNRYLTSWKSSNDPSRGEFSSGVEDIELPQIVLRKGSKKQSRIGPWNGIRFSGGPEIGDDLNVVPTFVYEKNEVYYTDKPTGDSETSRFVLNQSGLFQRLEWSYERQDWLMMYSFQDDKCSTYGKCGANGYCESNGSPVCECLEGFTPKYQRAWNLLNYTGGCVRIMRLTCGKKDHFELLTRMKLPDPLHYWLNKNISLDECEVECFKNCSCTAYTTSDIRGEGSGCILWFGDLIDIQKFSYGGQDLYIRIGASDVESNTGFNKKDKMTRMDKLKVILPVVSAILLLVLIISYFIWKKRRNRTAIIINNQENKLTIERQEGDLELPLFDIAAIAAATDNLSLKNKIGEGGFGPVYKGTLPTGQDIAIKRLSKNSRQGVEEFMNEVILIAKLQHRNLVRLLGCCIQGEERMLIYEFMPNKSLDFFIFDAGGNAKLNWKKRFDIIVGVARGLLYLHRDSRLRIIHRDLKASNILLDSQMNPKISDFGMARIFGGDQTEENTNRVVGTYGYMSPECVIDGLFSLKSDVFSFGVLVLEIVSGSRNRVFYHPEHAFNLLGHAWKLLHEKRSLELMDASMEGSVVASEVLKCIQLGLLCVQKFPEDRPTMAFVLLTLDSEGASLPWPKEPGFYMERSSKEESSLTSVLDETYTDKVSITLLEGR